MSSRSKSKKPTTTNNNNVNNVIGKGKVTPVQVAFIVDRYLADNNFSDTRFAFRSEASSLISKSSLHEAPKSLLSLGELLDEYIWLKEQKVIIEQEKCGLAQERCRIQKLLQGVQDLMTVFNSPTAVNSLSPPSLPPPVGPPAVVFPPNNSMPVASPPVYTDCRTPVMTSVSMTQSVKMGHAKFTPPVAGGRRKRKNSKDVLDAPHAPKKYYCGPVANYPFNGNGSNAVGQPSNAVGQSGQTSNPSSSQQSPPLQSSSPNFAQGGSPIQGSSVAKNLFNKPTQSPISNSSGPKTPPRAVSSPSDKSISPQDDVSSTAISNHENTPPETTPTNCTIISSKTIIVSPTKQFSIERNKCTYTSPAKTSFKRQCRDHVKGRLDFDISDVPTSFENLSGDGSTSSESEKEGDIFDLDLDNFEAFGPDFSLTELLTDFGIDYGDLGYSCPTTAGPSTVTVPESSHEQNSGETMNSQALIQHSSAVTEVVAADKSLTGSDSVTSIKSVRQCITIVSPTKSLRNSSAQHQ